MPEFIHHHKAAPIYGDETEAFDVVETDEIKVIQGSDVQEYGFATVADAIKAADTMAADFDAANLRGRTFMREGTCYILARDVREHDALDLEGDQYADPETFADPDYDPTPDETAHGFRFEVCRVYEVTKESPGVIVIETSNGTFGFPEDHAIEISLDASLADWRGD